MKTTRNRALLFNWIFISGLIVLFVNDQDLKWSYSNWLTGKLSDFAGLLILPMLLQFIFPRLSKFSPLMAGVFFVFWKLPVSQNFIDLYNKLPVIPIVRVIDYSDLAALSVLPLSYLIIQYIERFEIRSLVKLSLNPLFIIIPCSFVFMATSPPISYYMKPNGDIHIGKAYRVKMSKDKVLEILKEHGYTVQHDTAHQDKYGTTDNYLMENVVLNNGKDTLRSIEFGFKGHGEKTLFLLNNINLKRKLNLSDWKTLKWYSKLYDDLIDSEIIEELK